MGEMICVCREIDKNTGEIAVYPIKAEVTDRLLYQVRQVHDQAKRLRTGDRIQH